MLVYAMRVSEAVPWQVYGSAERFASKRPNFGKEEWRRSGDSIYYVGPSGEPRLRRSFHSAHHMEHDLAGLNVLVAKEFYYFGKEAVPLPSELLPLVKRGPGHRRCRDRELEERLVTWLRSSFPRGVIGEPYDQRPSIEAVTCRRPARRVC